MCTLSTGTATAASFQSRPKGPGTQFARLFLRACADLTYSAAPPHACARLFLVVLLCYSAHPLVTRRLGRSGTQATQADPQATGSTTPEAPLRYMASSVCTVFNPTSESVPT